MTSPPAILYKYRRYDSRSPEILINREIYFASPSNLNDPFDCKPNILDSLDEAYDEAKAIQGNGVQLILSKLTSLDHLHEKIQSDMGESGIFSLSQDPLITLMWSHYADDHKGFAIGFDFKEPAEKIYSCNRWVYARSVICDDENPFLDYFRKLAWPPIPSIKDYSLDLLAIGLTSKAKAWEYEKEARLIRRKGDCLVKYTPQELKEIIFGLNMGTTEQQTIRNILSEKSWSHVRFKKVERGKGFKLKIMNIP